MPRWRCLLGRETFVGMVCRHFGHGLFLCDSPCPSIVRHAPLRAHLGGQGLRPKIRPCPKPANTLPRMSADLAHTPSRKTRSSAPCVPRALPLQAGRHSPVNVLPLATGGLPRTPPGQVDKERAGRLTLLSLCPVYGTPETLTKLPKFRYSKGSYLFSYPSATSRL